MSCGERKGAVVFTSTCNLDFCSASLFVATRNSKDEFQAANPQQIPTQITTVAPKLVLPEVEPEVPPEQPEAMDPEDPKPPVDWKNFMRSQAFLINLINLFDFG